MVRNFPFFYLSARDHDQQAFSPFYDGKNLSRRRCSFNLSSLLQKEQKKSGRGQTLTLSFVVFTVIHPSSPKFYAFKMGQSVQ